MLRRALRLDPYLDTLDVTGSNFLVWVAVGVDPEEIGDNGPARKCPVRAGNLGVSNPVITHAFSFSGMGGFGTRPNL